MGQRHHILVSNVVMPSKLNIRDSLKNRELAELLIGPSDRIFRVHETCYHRVGIRFSGLSSPARWVGPWTGRNIGPHSTSYWQINDRTTKRVFEIRMLTQFGHRPGGE